MFKTAIASLILLSVPALASVDIDHATVYHDLNTTHTLVYDGTVNQNPFSTFNNDTGITVTAGSTTSVRADAKSVPVPGNGYLRYSTNGDVLISSSTGFTVGGEAAGRASGFFMIKPVGSEDYLTYVFGPYTNSFTGTLTNSIPSGDYNVIWDVDAFTMVGTGGLGYATITLQPAATPEPTSLGMIIGSCILLMRRR